MGGKERVGTPATGTTNGVEEQGKLFEVTPFPEQERYRIASLRELNIESERDLEDYYRLLTHPDNREHFSNPPVSTSDLKQKLIRDSTRAYLAEDISGRVIGAGGVNDAAEGEHDHFLIKIVVDPESQGKGEGKKLVVLLTDKAFSTRTNDGRVREKLDAAVIEGVQGWERMPHILDSLGFHFRSRLPRQVDVYDRTEDKVVRKPTQRWEIERDEWMRTKRRKEISQMLQPPTTI